MHTGALAELNALVSFDMVAKTQHFAKAADILCVSNSAVSQSIKHLEETIGFKLFQRSPKGVKLTEAGERYYQHIEPALGQIELATFSLQEHEHVLNLNLISSLSLKWFIPELSQLQLDEPELDLRLSTKGYDFDFNRDHIDLAITAGQPEDWPTCTAIKLMDHRMIAVAHPDYVHELTFSDILKSDIPLIQIENSIHKKDWTQWFAGSPYSKPNQKEYLTFQQTIQCLGAIKNLPSVGLLSNRLIEEDLKHGALTQVDPFELDTQTAYYIVYPKNRNLKPSMQKFIQWILKYSQS